MSIISKINHPLFVEFIGYNRFDFNENPRPVVVTEIIKKESLNDIIQIDREKQEIFGWNDTKKRIFIYGIASGMSYLHSLGIVHQNLILENILFDDFLYPKIANFSCSLKYSDASEKFKELMANDVYSFSVIAYEILINEKISLNDRPKLKDDIVKSYRDLIEKCWSQNPNDRPTFSEIINKLKIDDQFITEKVDKKEFIKYVNLLEKYQVKSSISEKTKIQYSFIFSFEN